MQLEWWNNFISLESSDSVDIKRKLLVLNACTYIGGLIILYFGLNASFDHQPLLKLSLLSGSAFLFLNVILLQWHKKLNIALSLYAIVSAPFFLSIVYSGGNENTGLYWIFLVPITLFVFFGHVKGLILNIIIFIGLAVMLINPEYILAEYRSEETSRFIASYIVNMAFCFINEFFRSRSHEELAMMNFEKQRQANSDPLTVLPNRRFVESIFFKMAISSPQNYLPLMFVVLDIDFFKKVNDTYGHDIGDEVLKHIAMLLKTNTRDTDIVARTGGEEFLIIFPSTSLEQGLEVTKKIKNIIEKTPFTKENKTGNILVNITVSMGCVSIDCVNEIDIALKQADELLYQAKNNGRNRIEYSITDCSELLSVHAK